MQIRFPLDSAAHERPRILIVEPNKTNLGVMARRLAEAGYRIATATLAMTKPAALPQS